MKTMLDAGYWILDAGYRIKTLRTSNIKRSTEFKVSGNRQPVTVHRIKIPQTSNIKYQISDFPAPGTWYPAPNLLSLQPDT